MGRSICIYVAQRLAVWLAAFFLLCAGPLSHFEAHATDEAELEGFTPRIEAQAVEETDVQGVKQDSEARAANSGETESKTPFEADAADTAGVEEAKPHAAASSENTDLGGVKPALLTRDMWNAEPALDGMWPHKPKGIVIHHTGVGRNLHATLTQKMKGLQHFSQRMLHPGPMGRTIWLDAPYHFYIDAKGELAEGRDAGFTSDSNTLYDTYGMLQVVMEGDFQREIPDARQMETLRKTLVWLSLKWNIHPDRIVWHRAKAATNCPGKHFLNQLPQLSVDVVQSRQKAIEEICAKTPSADFTAAYCSGAPESYAGIH